LTTLLLHFYYTFGKLIRLSNVVTIRLRRVVMIRLRSVVMIRLRSVVMTGLTSAAQSVVKVYKKAQ